MEKDFDLLNKFLDATIKGEESDAFNQYFVAKSKAIVGEMRQEQEKINEFNSNSSIKLSGDDVLINGKKIGQIKNDLDDMESGIEFSSLDGKIKKEFDDVESLYNFIASSYGVKEKTELKKVKTDFSPKPDDEVAALDKKIDKLKAKIKAIKNGKRMTKKTTTVEK